jgi:hypothetical protein
MSMIKRAQLEERFGERDQNESSPIIVAFIDFSVFVLQPF